MNVIRTSLNPMEILEVLGLDERPDDLADYLEEYVRDNLTTVTSNLISMGLIDDEDI